MPSHALFYPSRLSCVLQGTGSLTRGSRVGRLKMLTTIRGLAIECKIEGERKQALGWDGRRSAMAGGVGHHWSIARLLSGLRLSLSSARDVATKGIESDPGVRCKWLCSFGKRPYPRGCQDTDDSHSWAGAVPSFTQHQDLEYHAVSLSFCVRVFRSWQCFRARQFPPS